MSNEMEYRLSVAPDEYEDTWNAYLEARDAWLAMLARRTKPGQPCECEAHDHEPGPWHGRACDLFIPFVPKSLEGRYEDEAVTRAT